MLFINWLINWWRLKAPSPVIDLTARATNTFSHIHHRRRRSMTTATLRWTDPVTRIDGSALAPADISSIEVSDSHPDGSSEVVASVLPGVQTFTTGPLAVGAHAFTVVVRDTSGHSSARSNVATVTVAPTLADPSAVADLAAVLN